MVYGAAEGTQTPQYQWMAVGDGVASWLRIIRPLGMQ